jgi:ZIP family zinc transporter/zinc and cadmium transporter
MSAFAISLVLGLVAALADIFGGVLLVRARWEKRYLRYFVALGAGFMLAAAFLEMIPESYRISSRWTPTLVFAGYCVIHLIEHTISPHFHFGEETHHGEFISRRSSNSVIGGLAVHSLFDGVAIASGFVISSWLGWIIFVAVFLHKMPEGFTVASVAMASGRTRGAALLSANIVAVATLGGVLLMNFLPGWVRAGLPLSAGVAIYVAATDLLPEVNREPGIRMALVFFAGVAVFVACKIFADGLLHL